MGPETILVLHDDPPVHERCRAILSPAGHRLVSVTRPEDLPAALASETPSLVLTAGRFCLSAAWRSAAYRGPLILLAEPSGVPLPAVEGVRALLDLPLAAEALAAAVSEALASAITVRFWGVRGSIARASRDTIGYGGNTPCVEVRVGGTEHLFVWDAGTGIRELGRALGAGAPIRGYLCFSHFHWDHIQGLPFFEPAYAAQNHFGLVGPAQLTADILQILSMQMTPVYFPLSLDQFRATLSLQEIGEGPLTLGGVQFETLSTLHGGCTLAYRLLHGGKRVIYAPDNELPLGWKAAGGEAARKAERFLEFFREADLLIHDGQYTPEELERRPGWGHSAWTDVQDLAIAAGVKRLVLFHHDPDHSDAALDAIGEALGQRAARVGAPLCCGIAREGEHIVV
jgi:phosphoribosyl 1,2-cyclic phosphodiesterase